MNHKHILEYEQTTYYGPILIKCVDIDCNFERQEESSLSELFI